MKHFYHTGDWSEDELKALVERAIKAKGEHSDTLKGKSLALLFFNSSLRTRSSLEVAIHRLAGHSVTLEVGNGVWSLEHLEGAIMNEGKTEHIKDAARVLSSYFDAICIRAFPSLKNREEDLQDPVLKAFLKYSRVPVINLESALYHPCQAMADMMTIREHFGRTEGVKVALSWAYHIKALPTAVPNSFAVAAKQFGCNLTIVAPKEYPLPATVMEQLGNVEVTDDLEALKAQDLVYAKSWGSLNSYGEAPPGSYSNWMIDLEKIGSARFMHCMPFRRNVEVADDLCESGQNLCYDEAANRLHIQKEILKALV